MEYKVLFSEDFKNLQKQVEDHLNLKYTLQGGVSVSFKRMEKPKGRVSSASKSEEAVYLFAQAVVK